MIRGKIEWLQSLTLPHRPVLRISYLSINTSYQPRFTATLQGAGRVFFFFFFFHLFFIQKFKVPLR